MRRIWVLFLPLFFPSCAHSPPNAQVVSQKYIHKYGFEMDQEEWLARDQEGTVEQYLDNGVKVVKNYQNGSLHGETAHTYPYSSTIEKTALYEKGDLVKETVHDRKGIPIREKTYSGEGITSICYWSQWGSPLRIERYEKGALLEGKYYNAQNELESSVKQGEGMRCKRARDGLLLVVDKITKGLLVERTSYHPNGQIHMISDFSDYLLHGTQKIYTPKGCLYMVNNWEEGKLQGEKSSYREGQLLVSTNYEQGKKQGLERRYDQMGELLSQVEYQENERHGLSQYYGARTGVKQEWFYRGKATNMERFQMLTSQEEAATQEE